MTFRVDRETIVINVNDVLSRAQATPDQGCGCLGCRAKVALRELRKKHPGDYVRQLFGLSRELGLSTSVRHVPNKGFEVDVNGHKSVVPQYFDSMEHASSAGIGLVNMAIECILREDIGEVTNV